MIDASDHTWRLAVRLAAVLAFGAGAMDAITFSRLGDVFAGVMTGNLVLLGISIGAGRGEIIGRLAVALVFFTLGVLAAGAVTRPAAGTGRMWPRHVTDVLQIELIVIMVFAVIWQKSDATPTGIERDLLLGFAAFAMGLQSGAVMMIGIAGLSTTYLTGTLTSVLTALAHSREIRVHGMTILLALAVGAGAAALLVIHIPRLAPALPLCAVGAVVWIARRTALLGG